MHTYRKKEREREKFALHEIASMVQLTSHLLCMILCYAVLDVIGLKSHRGTNLTRLANHNQVINNLIKCIIFYAVFRLMAIWSYQY